MKETNFDDFDYVFIDTPPGVSDEHLGLINFINGKNKTSENIWEKIANNSLNKNTFGVKYIPVI